jgi:hypothetical protein
MRALLEAMALCGLVAAVSSVAMGQTQAPACGPADRSSGFVQVSARTGCPFSAVIEIEHTQTLADGTHVQMKSKEVVYRDSSGRIRHEIFSNPGPDQNTSEQPSLIQIYDPVTGYRYELLPQMGTARRITLKPPAAKFREGAQMQRTLPKGMTRDNLGTQEMEGIQASGMRTTTTIPAGEAGNDQDLTVISEIWRSSEMGIMPLEKTSDPRTGDTTRQMTNLERSEPDAALFEVPADYTIKDQ